MKILFLVVLGLSTISGCTVNPPKFLIETIFADLDQNKDGNLTYIEFSMATTKDSHDRQYMKNEAKKRGISLESYIQSEFSDADTNHNGKINFEEFYQRNIRKSQK